MKANGKANWRWRLAAAGLVIALLSAAALAYAAWPLKPASERFAPPPTLFAPPEGAWLPVKLA